MRIYKYEQGQNQYFEILSVKIKAYSAVSIVYDFIFISYFL